jgi:hypothetical protein
LSLLKAGALLSVLLPRYYSGDQIKKNDMCGICGTYGDKRCACRVLVGRPEGKITLGRPRRRWEDNIKIVLQEF